jgi:hypothetical protein
MGNGVLLGVSIAWVFLMRRGVDEWSQAIGGHEFTAV